MTLMFLKTMSVFDSDKYNSHTPYQVKVISSLSSFIVLSRHLHKMVFSNKLHSMLKPLINRETKSLRFSMHKTFISFQICLKICRTNFGKSIHDPNYNTRHNLSVSEQYTQQPLQNLLFVVTYMCS